MAYELKNGQGSIFRNDKKQSSNHPDYNGKIKTPDGKDWDVSLWVKDGKKGKFFSVSVKPPYNNNQSQSTHPVMQGPASSIDNPDDLPF